MTVRVRIAAASVLLVGLLAASAAPVGAVTTEAKIRKGCNKGIAINGTSGADDLGQWDGTPFPVRVYGKGGNDTLHGHNAFDCLFGGGGNDTLTGGVLMQSLLKGGAGNDTFHAAGIGDYFYGQQGDDQFVVDTNRDATNFTIWKFVDQVDCGPGYDTVWVGRYDNWDYNEVSCERVIYCPSRKSPNKCRRLACKPPAEKCRRSQYTLVQRNGQPRRAKKKPGGKAPNVDSISSS